MNFLSKSAYVTGFALTAFAAMPAAAQVSGIAFSQPEMVFVQSQALQTAFKQINTTYTGQVQQVTALRNETNSLQATLDTDNDGQLSQEEIAANPSVVQQIQQKRQQSETLLQPMVLAQYYVIEQLISKYEAASGQVISGNNIQIMLEAGAIQYAAQGADVTSKILAALNQSTPTVSATPPAGYKPRRETVSMYQSVQQIRAMAAQQQALQQQQQQQQQQNSGR